ncbi:MAG: GSU2403 family nucleotidyltransferase fold protein [Trebonia sp.]
MSVLAPEYIAARRALLDALGALGGHLDNLILVGAQAVYHHAGESDLNVPLMTTDADLAINATDLADVPEIGGMLRTAGFTPGPNPGHWVATSEVAVDLMVVPHQAGTTKASARAARLTPHEKLTARITRGLEPALLDNDRVTITALDTSDTRTFSLQVAGPAALLSAKAIKIGERLEHTDRQPDRLKEKDALDAFRILQAIDTPDLVHGFEKHQENEHAASVTAEALDIYRAHVSTPQGRIATLAANAAQGDPTVAPAFTALVSQLLTAL